MGKLDYQCTPWGNPTYNIFGRQFRKRCRGCRCHEFLLSLNEYAALTFNFVAELLSRVLLRELAHFRAKCLDVFRHAEFHARCLPVVAQCRRVEVARCPRRVAHRYLRQGREPRL